MKLTVEELTKQIENVKIVIREVKRRKSKNPEKRKENRDTLNVYVDSLIDWMGHKLRKEIEEIK